MNPSASCEIYSVAYKHAVRWKWRHVARDGCIVDAAVHYERLLECMHAARAQGYEPRAQWTACVRLAAEGEAPARARLP